MVRESPLRRLVDVGVSGACLAMMAMLGVLVALAIKLDTRGPVFFRHERMGRGGHSFEVLKFRTMIDRAENSGPNVAGTADPRITRTGHILRATKMDELPQFWNVLRGEMTLIGSRPEVAAMLPHYTERERAILGYKPGIIGPGQLLFTTEQAAELDCVDDPEAYYIDHHLHPKLAMDLDYLESRTLRQDLRLVARTIALVASSMKPSKTSRGQASA